MENELKITWLGHSCFRIESGDYAFVCDPFEDGSVPGLRNVRETADAVFCSHGHGDHSAVECVTLSGKSAPADFSMREFSCPHDDCGGRKRGANTARLFSLAGLTVCHLGDIGAMPDAAVIDALRGCDALLVPVGGFYTVDADTAFEICRAVQPRVIVPMHYRGENFGYDVIGTLDAFTKHFASVTALPGASFTLAKDTPHGCVIPKR